MTESYIITKENILKKSNTKFLNQAQESKNTNYVDTLKVFYLNPETSEGRRKNMEEQFMFSNIPNENILRIEPTKYPSIADHNLKNNIISWDHIKMWEKAFEENCDGAFFFEDDVYFLKNWKQIVEDIFNTYDKKNVDILRLDPTPLISVKNLDSTKITVFESLSFACMGAYYMSRDAIVTSLNFIKTRPWNWLTIEYLLKDITATYFKHRSFETSPRICIQNWFLNDGSAIQNNNHMKRIKDVMCSYYLPRYKDSYMFNKELEEKVYNILQEYTDNNKIQEKEII